MKRPKVNIAKANEETIQEYFEGRGYRLKRLDEKNIPDADEACEWFIETSETSFLCEVKTIHSVKRGRNTESEFQKHFEKPVMDYFRRAKVGKLAYHLRIDSDHMHAFIPRKRDATQEERNTIQKRRDVFLKWLKESILSIDAGRIPTSWNFDHFPQPQCWSEYTIEDEDGFKSKISVTLTRFRGDSIKVRVYWYGGLNLRPIEENVSKAMRQLRSAGAEYPGIARLVVLGFASRIYTSENSEAGAFSGLAFKERELRNCINSLLRRYHDLSAIGRLDWTQESLSPRKMEGSKPMSAKEFFSRFDPTAPALVCFRVYHNDNLQNVSPLDTKVFDDGRSLQQRPF